MISFHLVNLVEIVQERIPKHKVASRVRHYFELTVVQVARLLFPLFGLHVELELLHRDLLCVGCRRNFIKKRINLELEERKLPLNFRGALINPRVPVARSRAKHSLLLKAWIFVNGLADRSQHVFGIRLTRDDQRCARVRHQVSYCGFELEFFCADRLAGNSPVKTSLNSVSYDLVLVFIVEKLSFSWDLFFLIAAEGYLCFLLRVRRR